MRKPQNGGLTMPVRFAEGTLVIGVSSRALFDLEEANRVFSEEGIDAYRHYQVEREHEVLQPGAAFSVIRKLLDLNEGLDKPAVEVVLLSRNDSNTGLRVFNSINAHGLAITRAAFCGGESPSRYARTFGAQLFLSRELHDVRWALEVGIAAAMLTPANGSDRGDGILRIAFDGDAVVFSDDSERIYKEKGLEAFASNEKHLAHDPLPGGPFKPFLAMLHQLQSRFSPEVCPIRTALVTARCAPAHERVVRTLRAWDIRVDESLFLGGMEKGAFLKAFGADLFFDDQAHHLGSATDYEVVAGHVPYGIANA